MNSQDLQELLADFQAAYAQLAHREFTVVVAQSGKGLMKGRFSSMGGGGSVSVLAPGNEVVCYCFALMVRYQNPQEVWDAWRRLAGKAGAKLLPSDIAEAGVFDEQSPQASWCAFLIHRLRRDSAFVGSIETGKDIADCRVTIGGVGGLAHGVILRNPFGASVRAIQAMLCPESSSAAPIPVAGDVAQKGTKEQPGSDDGRPFYKPAYFKQWNIGDELLRKNATGSKEYTEGKVRRQRKQPSSAAVKSAAKGKRTESKGRVRPVYWYSEPDARKRWPEKFAGGRSQSAKS